MGVAPVSDGVIVSGEGGYLNRNGGDLIGHGIDNGAAGITDVIVSPDSGWFAGVMIGFASSNGLIAGFPVQRIEFYGFYTSADDSASDAVPSVPGTALKNVDATVLVRGGTTGATTAERTTYETGLRFETDQALGGGNTITWGLVPFLRWSSEDVTSVVTQCCILERSGNVDTIMAGVMLVMEPEIRLTDFVALVGRAGAGIYGYDADGDYRSSDNLNGFFAAQLSDGTSGAGFRGLLGAALKFRLSATANLETFIEGDYFSDVGVANMANNQPGDTTASHTGTTDLFELRAGGRLTLGLGGN